MICGSVKFSSGLEQDHGSLELAGFLRTLMGHLEQFVMLITDRLIRYFFFGIFRVSFHPNRCEFYSIRIS